jgi:putative endonuclease
MPHYVYILYSARIDKYYVGKSAQPEQRIAHHNSEMNRLWTNRGIPWQLKKTIAFEDESQATRAEKFIKNQKSRKFIEKIMREGWKTAGHLIPIKSGRVLGSSPREGAKPHNRGFFLVL